MRVHIGIDTGGTFTDVIAFREADGRIVALKVPSTPQNPAEAFIAGVRAALEEWHARTRFARRVPLAEVVRCLGLRPAQGEWFWKGGPQGGWQEGKAAFP